METETGLSLLSAFALFAVTAMLVTYALETKSSWLILAFAFASVLESIYGFLQGAWPFGLVEAVGRELQFDMVGEKGLRRMTSLSVQRFS